MIMDIRVNEIKFEAILNGDCTIVAIDEPMTVETIFRLVEDNSLGRILYARAEECITLSQANIRWFLKCIPYGVDVIERTVIRFSLTGMIEVEGNMYPMSEQVINEIFKNLDTDRNIDLSLCPHIVCVNDANEILSQFKFLTAGVNEDNNIQFITVKTHKGEKEFTTVIKNTELH